LAFLAGARGPYGGDIGRSGAHYGIDDKGEGLTALQRSGCRSAPLSALWQSRVRDPRR